MSGSWKLLFTRSNPLFEHCGGSEKSRFDYFKKLTASIVLWLFLPFALVDILALPLTGALLLLG